MVPSYGYPREPARKSQLLNNYMEKMRKIPCKYFDNGKGACRFGSACHYAHVDDNGAEIVPQQLRSYVDSSGGYTQHQEINLGMFFQKAERRKH
jgi:E3 ubiquitin-protein ligase makorin